MTDNLTPDTSYKVIVTFEYKLKPGLYGKLFDTLKRRVATFSDVEWMTSDNEETITIAGPLGTGVDHRVRHELNKEPVAFRVHIEPIAPKDAPQ